jgi:hypothetical protein
MCDCILLNDRLNALCRAGNLTLQEFNVEYLPRNPNIPHAWLQSKTDIVQRSFYTALALSEGYDPLLSARQFYDQVNDIFAQYNPFRNFLTYLVDGDQHCYTPRMLLLPFLSVFFQFFSLLFFLSLPFAVHFV